MTRLIIPKSNPFEKEAFQKANIKIIERLEVEEYEKEVRAFLSERNMLHLATCKNNEPRSTPLEYFNHGLNVHIFSEGGGKVVNMKTNSKVSYSISDPYHPSVDYFAITGLQVWGTASIFRKDNDLDKFNSILEHSHYMTIGDDLKRQNVNPLVANFHVITIEPYRIRYLNLKKGFKNITWKKED